MKKTAVIAAIIVILTASIYFVYSLVSENSGNTILINPEDSLPVPDGPPIVTPPLIPPPNEQS